MTGYIPIGIDGFIVMPTTATFTIADYSHELAGMQFYTASGTLPSNLSSLQASIQALSDGVIQAVNMNTRESISSAYPTVQTARRELKLLVGYSDSSTGKRYTTTIACPKDSAFTVGAASDYVDLTAGTAIPAFISAFEAVAESDVGNAVTVDYIKVVGRNN